MQHRHRSEKITRSTLKIMLLKTLKIWSWVFESMIWIKINDFDAKHLLVITGLSTSLYRDLPYLLNYQHFIKFVCMRLYVTNAVTTELMSLKNEINSKFLCLKYGENVCNTGKHREFHLSWNVAILELYDNCIFWSEGHRKFGILKEKIYAPTLLNIFLLKCLKHMLYFVSYIMHKYS